MLYFSPIHGTMTLVSRPPEYAKMTLSRAIARPFSLQRLVADSFTVSYPRPRFWTDMPDLRFQRLCLPRPLFHDMLEHARRELPCECCGLLAGVVEGAVGRVVERYPLVNALASGREFESEAKSMFAATRAMRDRGLEMLAVYHSHPTSAPVPSRTDLERNYSPDVVNVIVSLVGETPTVRAWWLTDKEYREAEWETGAV
jgi:proteasome lid subunit RPN8/RPN11